MLTPSDNLALAERIIAGDEEAACEFERAYRPRFESRARRAAIPNQDVSDVVQAIFLTVFSQLQRGVFRGDSSLGHWLNSIVVGKIMDYWRSQKAGNVSLMISSVMNEQGEEIAIVEVLPAPPIDYTVVLAVREALERMPVELRTILLLKQSGGLTLEEICKSLKRPLSTVRRRLIEAEETFRSLISGDSEEVESA